MKYIEHKGMKIEVEILETKNSYGRKRYKITPIAGEGEAIVENITN